MTQGQDWLISVSTLEKIRPEVTVTLFPDSHLGAEMVYEAILFEMGGKLLK